jgi:hypothetical protein
VDFVDFWGLDFLELYFFVEGGGVFGDEMDCGYDVCILCEFVKLRYKIIYFSFIS